MSTRGLAILPPLRAALKAAREASDARAISVRTFVALSVELPDGTDLTIDFGAQQVVGHPVVVIRECNTRLPAQFTALTPREREVAAYLAAGLPNREVATRLCLTLATVKDHVHRILAKTGLKSRTAVAAAWRADSA